MAKTFTRVPLGKYLRTRVTTLKPAFDPVENPFKLLALLTFKQWMFFLVGFIGWTWDAFDFFTVSLTVTDLSKTFNRSKTDITWGITLVLMFRSVGAIIFGIAADRYGRKWPFVVNNLLFIVLEMGTGFCQTYRQFLAVRALFGIAMGGLYGNAAATALEDAPPQARGLLSGILQQGYAFGYLLATVFARGLVNTTSHGWRPLYWFGAGPPVLIIIFRLCLPETDAFRERQALKAETDLTHTFINEGKVALRRYWLTLIYLVLLMAGFNFMSHGSQDLYPTMLQNQYEYSANAVTVTQVVANLGAMFGGTVIGYSSQIFGRRFSIISVCIVGGALLYPYTFIKNTGLDAAAFFEQACVQGAWGVIPIHLIELSPSSFRTFVVGTSYQLGNLVSSASATIESKLGERFPLPPAKDGTTRYEYGKVICIFMACVYVYVILLTFLGPEKRGRGMHARDDDELEEAVGKDGHHIGTGEVMERDGSSDLEKPREEKQTFDTV
jgi:SHS family lactate transporter-like MFS transporter